MKRSVLLLVVGLGCVSGVRMYAHHSQAAVYAINKDTKIEGEIAQILIRSPHSFVHVNAKNEKGEMVRWALEWGGAAQLSRQGVDGKTLKVGDKIIVGGHPGRNPIDNRMIVVYMERPSDGWNWGRRAGEVVD
jgi:uncharacterized protein DUF6152